MQFNWQKFCDTNKIRYVESGSNVSRGHIAIQCPFCGDSDPSEHMGLLRKGIMWGCWRVKSHRGRRPQRLIMKILSCSHDQANHIVGEGPKPDLTDFEMTLAKLKGADKKVEKTARLEMPSNFKRIINKGFGKRFISYLRRERGFSLPEALRFSRQYKLHYCMEDRWEWRIIIPFYMEGELVGWTGRTIRKDEELRYQSLSHEPEKANLRGDPVALMSVKDILYNFTNLKKGGGRTLYITEGFFDATKIDFYARELGVRATCIFSTDITDEQLWLLSELVPKFGQTRLLLDAGQLVNSFVAASDLSHLGVKISSLPKGVTDPGDLSKKQVLQLP
ncbi:hypothetical protein LCGC14_0231600 [marine sediment metagenome]|uniref:Toprim domain-containing protein n=1 Tax=marine sediment metagenome TaxID=412755 RepID=A0A0F9URB7_9ZZZZ